MIRPIICSSSDAFVAWFRVQWSYYYWYSFKCRTKLQSLTEYKFKNLLIP